MNIKPSTKLKVISVSKLKTMTCLRRYFWKYIMNLESKKLNLSFWWGGVLGAGFEALLLGKTDKQIRAAMKKEDKKRVSSRVISDDVIDELVLQRQLIEAIVFGAKDQSEVQQMNMDKSQIMFSVPLKCGLLFCGTEDGEGTYRPKPCMFENKTTSSVSESYLSSLTYGMQVNSYAWARRGNGENPIGLCVCCIFPKPKKRIKKGQTPAEFVEEIKQDIVDRPEMYYRWHKFKLGHRTVSETGKDIERQAEILKLLYDNCGDDLLNPQKWPKQESKCADYKGCEFIQLCMNPGRWKMYAERFFMQREMLYPEEKGELE